MSVALSLRCWMDFGTHAARTVADLPGPVGDGIDVSSDGQWILWSRADRKGSELKLIENFR
jgi:hypothetical protein